MDPELLQQLLAFLQTQPQYDTKGNVKPYGLDEQAKQQTFQNNGIKNLQNPLYAALLGGGGGFDPSVFQPVQDGADSYDVPQNPLDSYLGLPDGSDEKVIASKIAEGQSPTQVVASLNLTDPKVADRYQKFADGLFQDNAKFQHQISTLPGFDPSTGSWSPPEGGQVVAGRLVIPKYKSSEASQAFEKAGLPSPDKMFTAQDFGYDQQGSQQQLGDSAAKLQALQAQADTSRTGWQGAQSADSQKASQQAQLQRLLGTLNMSGPQTYEANQAPPRNVTPRLQQPASAPAAPPSRLEALQGSPEWAAAGGLSANPMALKYANPHPKDNRFDNSTAQGKAYSKYSKDVTAQRGAEKSLQQQALMDRASRESKTAEAKFLSDHGLNPLTLALLQRSRGLNQMGG